MSAVLRRVGVNAGWLLGARIFQAVLSIAYLAIATRALGVSAFGSFALVVAIGQGIAGVVGFQTWQFVVNHGTRAHVCGELRAVDHVIGFATLLDMAGAIVGCGLAGAAIVLLAPLLGLPHELYGAAFAFCFVLLVTVRSTPMGVLRLDQRFRDAALADAVTPAVRAAGALVAALIAPTVVGFLSAWAAAEVVTTVVHWWAALRRRKLILQPGGWRRLLREDPAIWRFVFATNLSSTLAVTCKQLTLVVVGAFAGPAAAGMFRVAAQLAQALVRATQSVSRAAYGELVLAATQGSDRALLAQLTAMAALVAAAMVGFAALLGEPLLHLIATEQFAGAYLPIVILVGAAAVDLLGFAFEPAMSARGQAGAAFRLRLVATIVQAALLLVLLPRFGMIGGAWATLGGSVAALALTGWGVLRRTGNKRDTLARPVLR